jgi:hypothetical protein
MDLNSWRVRHWRKEVLVLYGVGPYLKAKCQTLSAFLLVQFYLFVHGPNFCLSPKPPRGPHKMDSRAAWDPCVADHCHKWMRVASLHHIKESTIIMLSSLQISIYRCNANVAVGKLRDAFLPEWVYDKVTKVFTCHPGTALAYHADDAY